MVRKNALEIYIILVYTEMEFEWDENKALSNLHKHGVSFLDAITAFDDPSALIADDYRNSSLNEDRYWLIGVADTGILVVIFTIRGADEEEKYRIISARHATKKEKRSYERQRDISIS
jgi:uncharacterized DUF497 family protein